MKRLHTVPIKPWYASRTLWINGLILAAAMIDGLAGSPVLDSGYRDVALMTVALINAGIRLLTVSPIGPQE
jgi:hypothetical protein